MHTQEENEILTQSGPGTLMGNLLRRYWTPACLSVELPEPETTLRVRLYGEDLVAFRNTEGKVALIEEHCPHRGASLFYGRNEESGLRCVYHGWKFDTSGQCIDMPSERRGFAEQIRVVVYPTHESGGIVWTYMGPEETMTPFRDFGTESLADEDISVNKIAIDCNWLQSFDGDLDAVHVSFLHRWFSINEYPDDGTDQPGYPSRFKAQQIRDFCKAPIIELQEEWHGFRYATLRETPNGHMHVRAYAYIAPFTSIIASIPFSTHQIMIVPRDDGTTWRYTFTTQKDRNPRNLGGTSERAFPDFPYVDDHNAAKNVGVTPRNRTRENDYLYDREFQRTKAFSGVIGRESQDPMVTESMGRRYDRTKEHWATTDVALIKMHSILFQAARDVAEGKTPPALADGQHDFRSIRSAEKILSPGEDWRLLGTDDDPVVKEAYQSR